MTSNPSTCKLEVHVLGGSVGESIVVRTPDDKWGVIDCYAPSLTDQGSNATLAFLRSRNVTDLEFLGLTHPHADHFRGMNQFFGGSLEIRKFWRFAAMTQEHLWEIAAFVKMEAEHDDDEEQIESANDLRSLLRRVKILREQHAIKVQGMCAVNLLYRATVQASTDNVLFEIWAIAPSFAHIENYQDKLRKCFDADGTIKEGERANLSHNNVSAGLLIRFGQTSVVLGGDVEASNWADAIEACKERDLDLSAQAVKVSHHGSATGYTPDLWAIFSTREQPFAVITSFLGQGLPSQEGLDHIRKHTPLTFTPSRSSIRTQSTSFDFWEDYPLQVQLALRTKATSFVKNPASGVCSMSFDHTGKQPEIAFAGDAGPL